MNYLFPLFILLPLLAILALQFIPVKKEKMISGLVQAVCLVSLGGSLAAIYYWGTDEFSPVYRHLVTLYATEGFTFNISFYFDSLSAVFGTVGMIIFYLVAMFSKFYMHRDEGFRRFFSKLLLFLTGYNLIIFSGNFETLFMGWEIIGLSSFLLIAFYRNRYLPVKNAFKVLSIYRISDIALLVAMWFMHHLVHRNIIFPELAGAGTLVNQSSYQVTAIMVAAMFVLAAAAKSAQMPFSTWLPRAMEGPTSSSAIFYGSLSVHIGVFLLLRTYPFWQHMPAIKIAIIVIGAITAITALVVARTQPTAKTLIAYSSITQIGIIFIEVAMGWHIIAMIHFAGNAFLRTYQLLVSPSVLNYLVHRQYFHKKKEVKPPSKWSLTLYSLGVQEWNMDDVLRRTLWMPFKWMGRQFSFLGSKNGTIMVFVPAVLAAYVVGDASIRTSTTVWPIVSMAIALLLILYAFSSRRSAGTAWSYLLFAHFFILAGFISNVDTIEPRQLLMYASGILPAGALGMYCLTRTYRIDKDISLSKYHGYVFEQKNTALLFLLSAVGLLGFPVTAAFIGVDVLFTHIRSDQVLLIILAALCFLFLELAAIRIYCRIYLGLPKNAPLPLAFRTT